MHHTSVISLVLMKGHPCSHFSNLHMEDDPRVGMIMMQMLHGYCGLLFTNLPNAEVVRWVPCNILSNFATGIDVSQCNQGSQVTIGLRKMPSIVWLWELHSSNVTATAKMCDLSFCSQGVWRAWRKRLRSNWEPCHWNGMVVETVKNHIRFYQF